MLTTEQLEQRRHTLGSSDAPAIFGGILPEAWNRNAYSVWAEKTGAIEPGKGNAATDAGNFLESAVLDWGLKQINAVSHCKSPRTYTHPEHEWMTANLDAWASIEGETLPVIVEAKTSGIVGRWDPQDSWGEGVPAHVELQVMHQLAVTGWRRAYVAALIGGPGFKLFVIERDETVISYLVERLKSFWFDNVVAGVPPDVKPHVDVARRLRRRQGATVEIPATVALAHFEAKQRLLEAEKREDECRRDLLAALGDAEVGLYPDGGRVTFFANAINRRSLRHASVPAGKEVNGEMLADLDASVAAMMAELG